MNDLITNFTALGTSFSGKTCFIMGMYHKMSSGINGWNLTTKNSSADYISRMLKIMDSKKGKERFPPGTTHDAFEDYCFQLHYLNNFISSFHWIDYAGSMLEHCSVQTQEYINLEKSIEKSSCIYVFIDGDLLFEKERKKKEKEIRRKCADVINRYITNFMKNHDSKVPPVVFVITKWDICCQHTNMNEIKEILNNCFSSIFYNPDGRAYIVTVSLGENLSEDNYAGEIDPVNIQIPFFLGIYHNFLDNFTAFKYSVEKSILEKKTKIKELQNDIYSSNSKISEYTKNICDCEIRISSLIFQKSKLEDAVISTKQEISKAKSSIEDYEKDMESDKDAKNFLIVSRSTIVLLICALSGGFLGIGFGTAISIIQGAKTSKCYKKLVNENKSLIEECKKKISKKEKEISDKEKTIKDKNSEIKSLEEKIKSLKSERDKLNKVILEKEALKKAYWRLICDSEESLIKPEKMLEDIKKELEIQNENFIMFENGKEEKFKRS